MGAGDAPEADLLAVDPLDPPSLVPLWDLLGGPGRPDDAREKFQYAILALQRAILDARGEPAPPLPRLPEASDRDWLDEDEDEDDDEDDEVS